MRHTVGQTRNGTTVYVDLVQSVAAVHIAEQPNLLGLMKAALEATTVQGQSLSIERDMKRMIGYRSVVETGDRDAILYAKLLHDDLYTRFVKKGKPLQTSSLTMLLERDEAGAYEVVDVWAGPMHPPRPGAPDETAASRDFWDRHAYIYSTYAIQLRSRTTICPY